jgi:hypothetical protein
LLCYPKGRPLGFNVLIVIGKGLWNGGLGDTNRDYFNARGPLVCIGLENFDKLLVEFIELIDEYFLECVLRAELIDLMMNLVIDPCLIIVYGVVLDGLVRQIFVQSIHHLYLVKVDEHSPGGTTWHIVYFISLHGDLHLFKGRDNGYFQVPPGCGSAVKQSTTSEIDGDMALVYLVQARGNTDSKD